MKGQPSWFCEQLWYAVLDGSIATRISEYNGPYGKVAEKYERWRRPFEPLVGIKSEALNREAESSDSKDSDGEDGFKEKKKKKTKEEKSRKERRTKDWIIIQEMIYSPKEARRLSKEYKYVKHPYKESRMT